MFVWECECDWAAGEVNERERGVVKDHGESPVSITAIPHLG